MEFERRELRGDGKGASFYASSSSAARYPSDAGLSRYGINALGSSLQRDQVRQLSYNTDSTFFETGRGFGPPGPSLRDPLPAPSYREDLELEIRRCRLRERADRFELAHIRMLEEHDRRALAIAERAPYARHIPFYPELPPDNGRINHSAQVVPDSRSLQRVAPMYHELPGERSELQKELNMGPHWSPRAGVEVPPILRREEFVPHAGLRFYPELRDGARSRYQPIEPLEAVCHDPILQNQLTGYNTMLLPQIMHEPPPPLVVPLPVPVPIIEKKVGSSADTNKKGRKEYGHEVIEVKPTMRWSKWPCVWCSVNFDSKEAMDAHLKEQHQGCKGNGSSESQKVNNNRNEETRTGLTVRSDDDQQEISEVSGPHTNKKIQLQLPPFNFKRKSYKARITSARLMQKVGSSADTNKKRKEEYGHGVIEVKPMMRWSKWPCVWCSVNFNSKEAMDTHLKEQHQGCKGDGPSKSEKVENNRNEETRIGLTVRSDADQQEISEVSGPHTNKKIQLVLPPFNFKRNSDKANKKEVEPISEDREIVGSSPTKKIKLDLPPSNLRQIPNEVVQTPKNKDIPGSSSNIKMKLDLPPSNLKQKPDEPSKEEVVLIPENKEKPATGTTEPGWVVPEDGRSCNLHKTNTLTKRTVDDHFESNAHLEKLNAVLNGSQKSKPAEKIVAEKPVQGVSQAVSVPKLEEPKEKTSKFMPMLQSDKQKEVTSQDKSNPSSSNRTVITTGHEKTAQPTPKFSNKKNCAPVNGITKPVVVMKDGKWFCNLCEAKWMTEKSKEDHIKGKRHRNNLQFQTASHTPEPNKPSVQLSHTPEPNKPSAKLLWCYICKICCTNENGLIEHFKGKKHRETLMKQMHFS